MYVIDYEWHKIDVKIFFFNRFETTKKISSSYFVNNLNPDRYPYLWEVFEASISQRENITLTDFYLSKDFLFHF